MAQKTDPNQVWAAFRAYFEPKSNFRLARFQLRELTQEAGESIDTFVTRLKVQAGKCNFATPAMLEDNVIDQIIKGTAHSGVWKAMLDHDPAGLTLDRVLDTGRTHEATQAQLQNFQRTDRQVDEVRRRSRGQERPQHRQRPRCGNCGGQHHNREVCPAKGQSCHHCHKIGHWAKLCRGKSNVSSCQSSRGYKEGRGSFNTRDRRSGQNRHSYTPKRHVHSLESDTLTGDFESLTFNSVSDDCFYNDNHRSRTEAYATIQIQPYRDRHTNLRGKADTGAQGNILPLRTFKNLYPTHVDQRGLPTNPKPCRTTLTVYNGTEITQYGVLSIPSRYKDDKWKGTTFYVADTNGPVIFGLPTCIELGLVTMHYSVDMNNQQMEDNQQSRQVQHIKSVEDLELRYPDCFEGLGKFPGKQKLTIDQNVPPVIHAPRRAPVQLRDKIKAELDRMQTLGVIRPVEEPTDWVSSITYVPKPDGSLRICLDPKDVNNALKRSQHHIPTVDELTHRFAQAKVFSKLDAKSGYWCIELDEDSQLLTTFNSPFGRYCFTRLPFGLKVSQDVFQKAMDKVLDGLKGVLSIADDITVYGSSQEEHDENLHNLMKRAREIGLVFNYNKCQINRDEVPFFGNIYSKTGVKPDPVKVQAITDLAEPRNKKEL